MNRLYAIIFIVALIAIITFFTGPKVPTPTYVTTLPEIPGPPEQIAERIDARERQQPLREGNGAHVRFFGDSVQRTEYVVVYLHGFGGSWYDAYPLHYALADSLGANAYLARWGDHGLQPPHCLVGFTAESAWGEVREALAIGKRLGDKVIIVSTSTGGTFGLKLAAEFPDDVHALVNLSPNVKDDVPGAWILNTPWGAEVAALIGFGDGIRKVEHEEPAANQYFDTAYVASALVNLQNLVATTMTEETFAKVRCPVLTLYYYEDALNEDERIEVDQLDDLHAALGTQEGKHLLKALPTPKNHFLGSEIKSEDWRGPLVEALRFLRGSS